MSMPTLKRRWTFDDIQALPDDGNRYEVIDGELFVTPAPSYRHQAAVSELHALLREYLSGLRVGYPFFSPADVVFSPTRAVQPDIFVVPLVNGRRPERFEDVNRLLLAIEVLSPSTARADRVAKRTLFRQESVDEYWIVDMDSRTLERSTPGDPRVEVLDEQLSLRPDGAPTELRIDLPAYFSRVLDG